MAPKPSINSEGSKAKPKLAKLMPFGAAARNAAHIGIAKGNDSRAPLVARSTISFTMPANPAAPNSARKRNAASRVLA